MNTGNEISTALRKTFLNLEAMMKSKPVNYMIIVLGVSLFVSFICMRNDPRICNSIPTFTIAGVIAIVGAMLVLFGIINLAAIFNRNENKENSSIEE
jgi:uncharacterized membrane protein HdeD (DUF308 family)